MLQLNFCQQLGELSLQIDTILSTQGITAILGLSGSGKTSLINVIAGLSRPQSGQVILNNRVLVDCSQSYFLPPEQRRVGYVFQDARLFPHYRVRGNLEYGMVAGMRHQFEAIIELLGIGHLLKRFPLTLSGGEKQRVAIGRALLTAPELLLMDEPLASLDMPRKRELMPYLDRLAKEVQIPILYVSHSMEEILRLASHVLLLDRGRVLGYDTLESVWASSVLHPWLQKEEQNSVLKVRVLKHHSQYAMSALTLGEQHLWVGKLAAKPGQELHIGIRAADVSLALYLPRASSIRNILAAQVEECQEREDGIDVKLVISGQTVWAQITPWARDELGVTAGQKVFAQIKSVSISRENW